MDLSVRVRLSVMMFLQYFIWGAWGVVIFTYIAQLPTDGGLDFPGSFQGWIGATLPIGAMISPFFIGLFADRFFATERVLAFLHLAGAVLLAWAAYQCDRNLAELRAAFDHAAAPRQVGGRPLPELLKQSAQDKDLQKRVQDAVKEVNGQPEVAGAVWKAYFWLFGILLAYALCYMPTITLTNSLSFRNLADPDRYFGSIRVLGTIGWIVAGLIVGLGLRAVSTQPLYLAAVASACLGLFCFALPHTPPAGGAKTVGDTLGLPALAMLKNTSFLVFFICSFLITIVLAFYYQQGNPFINDIGTPYPAAVQTLGQVSEIFFMLLIPVGLARLGTKGMLALGMLAWCLRYAIFASRNVAAVIALGLPLHGVCYDFFFVVSYLYVDRQAPPNLRASAQGMITWVTLGVGMFLGNLVAGRVVERYTSGGHTDWTATWLVPLAGSVVATILFVLLFWEARPAPAPVTVGKAMEGLEPAEPPEQVH